MAGTRGPVGVLILFDMNEMPVEVGYEDGQRRAIGAITVGGIFNRVRSVEAGEYNRKIGLFSWRGEFVGARFS